MKNENQLIQWVENQDEDTPECHMNRSHADPTADEAIGNVMQEERRKTSFFYVDSKPLQCLLLKAEGYE